MNLELENAEGLEYEVDGPELNRDELGCELSHWSRTSNTRRELFHLRLRKRLFWRRRYFGWLSVFHLKLLSLRHFYRWWRSSHPRTLWSFCPIKLRLFLLIVEIYLQFWARKSERDIICLCTLSSCLWILHHLSMHWTWSSLPLDEQ